MRLIIYEESEPDDPEMLARFDSLVNDLIANWNKCQVYSRDGIRQSITKLLERPDHNQIGYDVTINTTDEELYCWLKLKYSGKDER